MCSGASFFAGITGKAGVFFSKPSNVTMFSRPASVSSLVETFLLPFSWQPIDLHG